MTWCEEAFAKAREEDKPIFFSCDYSTSKLMELIYS
ncbi:DUF255 domain-containing protein [Propionispora vibrioides]|nr:DUF255 domain-containing protein [Propionispora vibrioides]